MNKRSFQPLPPAAPAATPDGDIVLDFGRILAILRQGWWIIAGTGFAGALIGAIMVLRVEPTYSATAQLLMGQKSRAEGPLGALMQDLRLDDDAISGEIAIITSGRTLAKVSARLDLARRPEFNAALRPPEPEAPLPVRLADWGVDLLKRIIGAGQPPGATPETGGADVSGDPITSAARIGTESLGDQADYVGELMRGLSVRQVGNTNLVDVRFKSTDRLLAAAIPNAVVDVYLEDQLDRKFDALRRVTGGLQDRLENMRERLEASERAVIEYRNRNLTEGFGGSELLTQQIGDLSRRLSQATAEQAELDSDLAGIDALIDRSGLVAAAGLFASDLIDRTQAQITELRERQEALRQRFGEDNQQMLNMSVEIKRLEATVAKETQRLRDDQAQRAALAAARVEALRRQLRVLETRAIEQAEREVRLTQLERDYAAEQAVYTSFLDKFTAISESMNLQEGDAQIISYADPPSRPIAPDKKMAVALGGIAGGFGGMGLVFLRTLTDRRIRTTAQLRALTGGATVFTQPRTAGLPFRRQDPLRAVAGDPLGPLSESVRSLRSHLMLSGTRDEGGAQVVTFISTGTNCGKTTTSLLLARALSQMGAPCVVIDADLRRSSMATMLDLPPQPDLIDVLKGEVPLDEALKRDPASRARILTARTGINDPAGVLLSDAMSELVRKLRSRFRIVIFDTAPLMPVSDAVPLIRISDNVVLMVRYGTPLQELETGLEQLDKLGTGQVCAVLSMAPRTAGSAYSYNYNS